MVASYFGIKPKVKLEPVDKSSNGELNNKEEFSGMLDLVKSNGALGNGKIKGIRML